MNTPATNPPFERIYDLSRLSEAGYETDISPPARELETLAEWANVSAVTSFKARVSLKRASASRFHYSANLVAEITQNCTVTLEPVPARIALEFARSLHLVPKVTRTVDYSGELSPGAGDDLVPEEIDSPRFDLAAPVLEEFLLAIDPYPRAPGVAFEAPSEAEEGPESPFEVLKSLKQQG